MQDSEGSKGASPEEVRSAIRGWAILAGICIAVFGAAFVWIEL